MPHPSLRRGPAPRRFDHGAPIRAIDTRPMLFVALFIAVLFLLAASQTPTHALLIKLPQPEAGLLANGDPPVVYRIEVTAADRLRLNGELVSVEELVARLSQASKLEPRPVLAFEPDGAASYNLAAHTLAVLQRAGLNDERFCIDGMEKHGDFNMGRGHPLPLLVTLMDDGTDWTAPLRPPPDIDTCAPQLYGTRGR
ncbi:ExbD/TolR family protein [Erythrobacter colymbi]|uniref:ExbD/TolR family protein n=1 Tax=Erythrobacter colymbi TaxID=1161202 RepID=UPI000A37E983|nr:biopolymer transporter ExbD [Erythrobacter colymbi]